MFTKGGVHLGAGPRWRGVGPAVVTSCVGWASSLGCLSLASSQEAYGRIPGKAGCGERPGPLAIPRPLGERKWTHLSEAWACPPTAPPEPFRGVTGQEPPANNNGCGSAEGPGEPAGQVPARLLGARGHPLPAQGPAADRLNLSQSADPWSRVLPAPHLPGRTPGGPSRWVQGQGCVRREGAGKELVSPAGRHPLFHRLLPTPRRIALRLGSQESTRVWAGEGVLAATALAPALVSAWQGEAPSLDSDPRWFQGGEGAECGAAEGEAVGSDRAGNLLFVQEAGPLLPVPRTPLGIPCLCAKPGSLRAAAGVVRAWPAARRGGDRAAVAAASPAGPRGLSLPDSGSCSAPFREQQWPRTGSGSWGVGGSVSRSLRSGLSRLRPGTVWVALGGVHSAAGRGGQHQGAQVTGRPLAPGVAAQRLPPGQSSGRPAPGRRIGQHLRGSPHAYLGRALI